MSIDPIPGAPPQYPPAGGPFAPGGVPGGPAYPGSSTRIAAGVCGILLGALGIHKFIIGAVVPGVVMLLVSIVGACFTFGLSASVMGVIGLIEGIIYLTKTDEEFYYIYQVGKKGWF